MELTPTLPMTHITITKLRLVLHDIELQRLPLQLDEQYSMEYYSCYKMIIANEILKPLNWLILIDCVQTTYEIVNGFHYFNNVNTSIFNYYVILVISLRQGSPRIFMDHKIGSLAASLSELFIF